MRKPEFITFTGIDDQTDLKRADQLARTYPIEWGVLMSDRPSDSRFPSQQTIADIAGISGRKSAHLCGGVVKHAKQGDLPEIVRGGIFHRVQVNGRKVYTDCLVQAAAAAGIELVIQTRAGAFQNDRQCFELFDCSGGRGLYPDSVPDLPGIGKLVGYSGGIGPSSVKAYLRRIRGEGEFWIDMEGKVRTHGWFDLDYVEHVCHLVYGW